MGQLLGDGTGETPPIASLSISAIATHPPLPHLPARKLHGSQAKLWLGSPKAEDFPHSRTNVSMTLGTSRQLCAIGRVDCMYHGTAN